MRRIDAPFPFQPQLARVRRVKVVFDLESHVARKILCAFADDQVMIGLLQHRPGDQRRRAHAFDGRDRAGLLPRSVHA